MMTRLTQHKEYSIISLPSMIDPNLPGGILITYYSRSAGVNYIGI